MIHSFQELQGHHGGEAGAWAVLTKVLTQGTGVAGGEGDRDSGYRASTTPSISFTTRMTAFPLGAIFLSFPQVSFVFPPTIVKLESRSWGLICSKWHQRCSFPYNAHHGITTGHGGGRRTVYIKKTNPQTGKAAPEKGTSQMH